jgi:hypothetical protein
MAAVSLQRDDSEKAKNAKEREKPRGHMRILQDGQRITPESDHVHFITSTKEKFDSGYMDEAGTATCNSYSAQSLPCSETRCP